MALPASVTTVTPFSRLLALVLFILFPVMAFYFGMSYGKGTPSSGSNVKGGCATTVAKTASCRAQNQCTEEAKECPDGTYVFREGSNCDFAACPSLKTTGPTPATTPKNGATKENQITLQLSQKTGIPQLDLIVTYKNTADNKNLYDGGTYNSKKESVSGRWIATKVNGNWTITSLSAGMPLCSEVNPYFYPKELVPACKDAKGNITAR